MMAETVDLQSRMKERVAKHAQAFRQEFKARNPAIPDDVFDFSRSGLPSSFDYHPVDMPNPNSTLYMHQVGILNSYIQAGFEFLTDDLVTRDGRNGTAAIPDFVSIDGKVVVAGCYILFADHDWYNGRRARNTQDRNAILDRKTEAREENLESRDGRNLRKTEMERRDVTLDQLTAEEGQASGSEDGA